MKEQKASLEILKQYFGYDTFREGQEYLIENQLKGNDVVGIMPTGAGKSICFQVPAIQMEGITLVISPLISLMKDQVNGLTQQGVAAAFINSTLTPVQYRKAIENAKNDQYKIIYVAPERLLTEEFMKFAQESKIVMITIDEAHCISQWGQDFRPSYLKVVDFIERLPQRPVISAFTATATAQVREDIIEILKLKNPKTLVTGFDRPNLYFEVQKPSDKFEALLQFLGKKEERFGIIYCSTRNTVEEVCERLKEEDYNVNRYHAGLTEQERRQNQEDFIYDKVKIMVATNAFGMGIDKSNVSFVVHYNMPKNIESYYQEAGRAGRDGSDAECLLLYNGQDVRTNLFFIENSKDVVYESATAEKEWKERDRERLKSMTYYCHTNECLRQYILKYFGERAYGNCDNCSSCHTNFEALDITIESQKILSCIKRAGERYGIQRIIEILRGSKNEKIVRLGLDQLSTYNIMKEVSEKRIRAMINHLVLEEYLQISNDEYPLLQLGKRAGDLLFGNVQIEMKLVKDMEKVLEKSKTKKKKEITGDVDRELFDRLRKIRATIAAAQGVPAFVVFTDATLADMCKKQPMSKTELLQISGVGQVKLDKYGEKFMEVIKGFIEGK